MRQAEQRAIGMKGSLLVYNTEVAAAAYVSLRKHLIV